MDDFRISEAPEMEGKAAGHVHLLQKFFIRFSSDPKKIESNYKRKMIWSIISKKYNLTLNRIWEDIII